MASLLVLALLLLVVLVGAWFIWRPGRSVLPASAAQPRTRYDKDALLSPYRERFEALLNGPGGQDPQKLPLLDQAYALSLEGSALVARLQVSARTAELPVSVLDTLQNQIFEMRERREALDSELADLSGQLSVAPVPGA